MLDRRQYKENGRDIDAWWSSSLRPYSLSWYRNARTGLPTLPSCYVVVSFLLLNVTVFCELMNVSEAIRQLSRRLAFNLRNLRLFGTELKPAVGLGRNFTVEQS